MGDNIVIASANSAGRTKTRPLYQYDYGQVLRITGLELPAAYEVHFANSEKGDSITQIGSADGVIIPDCCLQSGADIYAWLYLHTGTGDGETVYKFLIPVHARAAITSEEPTPVQQDAISQAIAALNSAVEKTAQDVEQADDAAQTAQSAAASAHNNALAAEESAREAGESANAARGAADTAQTLMVYPAFGGALANVATVTDAANDQPMALKIAIQPRQSGSGTPAPDNLMPIAVWTGAVISHSGSDMSAPGTHAVAFPAEAGAVGCGTLEIAEDGSGTLTVDMAYLDGTGWNQYASDESFVSYRRNNCPEGTKTQAFAPGEAYANFTDRFSIVTGQTGVQFPRSNLASAFVRVPVGFDVTKVQLLYPVLAPQVYHFTAGQIKSLFGVNNLWTDCGLTQITAYTADKALLIARAEKAIEDLSVSAETLPAGSAASVEKQTDESGAVNLHFGLPRGEKGGTDLERVESLDATLLTKAAAVEAMGEPRYVDDPAAVTGFQLTETGWYIFARVHAPAGVTVSAGYSVSGAAGVMATVGGDHVDLAILFDVAAQSKPVVIDWGSAQETFVFKATDLAIRNLDYRTTFYVYDIAPYTTWEYALTADATFAAGKKYFTKAGDVYIPAEVTAGEAVPADTYYQHSKVTFAGMARNVTYQCSETIDCPQVYVLPEIEDETHGCWYEIRLRHSGSYSSTLQVPEGVKVATEHTQAETAGLNMVDLHYSNVDGVKIWRFLNTHSTIPA